MIWLLVLGLWMLSALVYSTMAHAQRGNPERYPIGSRAAGMGGVSIAFGLMPWHNIAGLGHVIDEAISGSISAYGYSADRVDRFFDAGEIHGTLRSESVDLFPASLEYLRPLGVAGGLRHGIGFSIVVPDFDQFDGTADVPAETLAFELKARREATAQTTWLSGGWGACTLGERSVCFGVGPALALHQEKNLTLQSLSAAFTDGNTYDATNSLKTSTTALALAGQLGVQVQPAAHLWLGFTVRSPAVSVFGTGSILALNGTVDTAAVSYVDRVEVLSPTVKYRQPWRLGLGVGYQRPRAFALGVDLHMHLAQAAYLAVAGEHGETRIAPISVTGDVIMDPGRTIDIAKTVETFATLNANLGAELYVTPRVALQAGAFTDLSGTPLRQVATGERVDRLSRYGASLGVGLVGKETTTWITVVGALGHGDAFG